MKYEKSCGAIVFRKNDNDETEALLIRHKNSTNWTFPKGHIEFGENEFETALREVKEETGLDIILNAGFREKLNYHPKSNILKEVVYFLARLDEDEENQISLTDDIVDEVKWFEVNQVKRLLSFQNHKALFEKALVYYYEKSNKNNRYNTST